MNSEKFKRGAMFLSLWVAIVVIANGASAQADTAFLDLGASWIKGIFDHNIWGIALAAVILMELIMFGLTKQLKHVIGIIVPALCLGAWIGRASLLSGISGFSW